MTEIEEKRGTMKSVEEIIIDGVNVKDCRRRIGKNNYCRYFKRPCAKNNFNCIWKQNERLKQQLEIDKQQINYFIEETEKLKTIIQDLRELSLKTYDVADFQIYFDKLDGKNEYDL